MGIFGMGSSSTKAPKKSASKKSAKKSGSQSSEAAAVLKKMKAKKDAGDCAFC